MILKSLERVSWRFSSKSPFTPNKKDLIALNEVIEYINNQREETFAQNVGFAKLYIWAYSEMCRRYDATPMEEVPQKELHRLLDQPIEYFVKKFTQHLNRKEQEEMLVEAGIVGKNYLLASDEEKQKRDALVLEALKKPENVERFEGRSWDEETVFDNLKPMIADAIIKFKL